MPILPVHDIDAAVAFWSLVPSISVDQYEEGGYAYVDQRYAECVDADLPVSEIRNEPWGMREFRLTDPSGNLLRIGWPLSGRASGAHR